MENSVKNYTRKTITATNITISEKRLRTIAAVWCTPVALYALSAGSIPVSYGQINFDVPVVFGGNYDEVVVADFQNDGLMDFATIEYPLSIRTFRNMGNEVFVEDSLTPISLSGLDNICVGDFNNDKYMDIACCTGLFENTTHILLNDGTGQFPNVQTLDYLNIKPAILYPLDLDNDGDSDLISLNFSSVSTVENTGGANFKRRQTYTYHNSEYIPQEVAFGDIDNDGDLDLAILFVYEYADREVKGRQVVILSNDGNGYLTEKFDIFFDSPNNRMAPDSLSFGDLDGDSDLDLSIASGDLYNNADSEIQFLENIGKGSSFNVTSKLTYPEQSGAGYIRNADLDTDGDLDIIVTNAYLDGFYVLENLGGFNFGPATAILTLMKHHPFYFGDMNNDGQIDIMSDNNGLAYVTNITPVIGRNLLVDSLIRGQSSFIEIDGLEPGEKAWFLYSTHGWGKSFGIPPVNGIVLDLTEPVNKLGSAIADENGIAHLNFNVPAIAPPIDIVFQAVVRRGNGGKDSIKSKFAIAPVSG